MTVHEQKFENFYNEFKETSELVTTIHDRLLGAPLKNIPSMIDEHNAMKIEIHKLKNKPTFSKWVISLFVSKVTPGI